MSIANRINSLENRHNEIEDLIRKAYLNHEKNEHICELKKEKLLLKEELNQLLNTIK